MCSQTLSSKDLAFNNLKIQKKGRTLPLLLIFPFHNFLFSTQNPVRRATGQEPADAEEDG